MKKEKAITVQLWWLFSVLMLNNLGLTIKDILHFIEESFFLF